MADLAQSPLTISQNEAGVSIQFPAQLWIQPGTSLANVYTGNAVVSPLGNPADRFVYNLPRLSKSAKVIQIAPEFNQEVLIQNIVTPGLNPSIKLDFLGIRAPTSADLILYDGRGALNDGFINRNPKFLNADSLNQIIISNLLLVYNLRLADFAPNAIFSPDLAAGNFVRLYMQMNVYVKF